MAETEKEIYYFVTRGNPLAYGKFLKEGKAVWMWWNPLADQTGKMITRFGMPKITELTFCWIDKEQVPARYLDVLNTINENTDESKYSFTYPNWFIPGADGYDRWAE